MKKIKYSLICCSLLTSVSLNGIDLEKGWNLVSLPSDINISDISNQNIKSIWSYGTNWKAYSFDTEYNNLLKDNNIESLIAINSSQGVWIQTLNNTTISNLDSKTINEIDIKKGWNLIGTIEDNSNIKEIDSNALYWKYSNGSWKLGDNKEYSGIDKFSDISKDDGIWVYSGIEHIYKENKEKKFLFLDENLIPQKVSFGSKVSSLDGYIHFNYKESLFDFNNSGFVPFSAGYENGEPVSEYISNSDENYAIFLEDNTNQVSFENNSSDFMKVPYFVLPDYNINFEEIKFIAIEAKPIKPLLMSANVIMILSNVNMKQSLTLSFEDIDTKPNNFPDIGEFKLGVSTKVQGSDKKVIDPITINGQMNLKPIFKNVSNISNPYIYALNGDTWELVGKGYISKSNSVVSKNWYNKFTSFALVDVDSSTIYNKTNTIKNEKGQLLRDVLVVSNNKIAVSTNKDGNFTYSSPSKPLKLVAHKKGYKPQILDINSDEPIIMKPLEDIALVDGVDGKYDKDFNTIYTIGDKNKEFTYLGDDYSIKPKLLANTDSIIYSTIYPYNDGYVFGASNSIVSKIEQNGTITKLKEGDGIIYDGLVVENNNLYYGTFGDTFVDLTNNNIASEDDFGAWVDISVVYKPIITDSKIYIPTQSQDSVDSGFLIINDLDNVNISTIENVGNIGKLSQTTDEIIFGTSQSKIVFVDKTNNNITKTIDFNGSSIIAEVVTLNNSYFAIDVDGVLKKYDSSKEFVDSLVLTPSSNILSTTKELIVADNNGTIYTIDENLDINSVYSLNGNIVAKPIIYNENIYIITSSGKFYKNTTLIGTFNTKVSNMNLVDGAILFAGENGTVWKIEL